MSAMAVPKPRFVPNVTRAGRGYGAQVPSGGDVAVEPEVRGALAEDLGADAVEQGQGAEVVLELGEAADPEEHVGGGGMRQHERESELGGRGVEGGRDPLHLGVGGDDALADPADVGADLAGGSQLAGQDAALEDVGGLQREPPVGEERAVGLPLGHRPAHEAVLELRERRRGQPLLRSDVEGEAHVTDQPVVDAPGVEAALRDLGGDVADDPAHIHLPEVVTDDDEIGAVDADAVEGDGELVGEGGLRVLPEPELAAEQVVLARQPGGAHGFAEQQVGAGVLGVRTHVVVRDVEEGGADLVGAVDERDGVVRRHPVPGVPGAEREHGHLGAVRAERTGGDGSGLGHEASLRRAGDVGFSTLV
jgi:hypothetical protein